MGNYHAAPQAVLTAEGILRDQLVGATFPKQYQAILGSFVLESQIRPGAALEDLSITLLKRKFKDSKLTHEPFGKETYPDIQLSLPSGENHYFEVKSKASQLRKLEVDLASVKQFFQYTANGDPRYWTTDYLLWVFQEDEDTVTVEELEVGKLWQLAGRTETGSCKAGSAGSGRTKYIQRGTSTFESPAEFLQGVVRTYQAMGYSTADVRALMKGGAKILHQLG